jgi:hypothetical protein
MRCRVGAVFGLLCSVFANSPVTAQNQNDIINIFGAIVRSGVTLAAQSAWEKLPPSKITCVDQRLRQRGSSINSAIQQGIGPTDARVFDVRSACRNQLAAQPTRQGPSFDCTKARMPDERGICSSAELSRLDNLVVSGYAYLRDRYGAQFAESIGNPLWRARQACGSDIPCIKQRQIAAIEEYRSRGAPVVAPEQPATPAIGKSIYIVDGLALGRYRQKRDRGGRLVSKSC